jgi:glycosyltransferase involved in cell wall biosynthesis
VSGPLVSVVVPTLQEERALPPLLDHLDALPGRFEVIVSDGGSDDGTRRIARERGARLIAAPRGRAAQMNAGARVCSGSIIVFLHADTRLPMTAYGSLARAARRGVCGGNFALRFDGGGLFSAFLGAVYRKQRALRVFYGDSAIWATRETFARLGGFPEQPIMEPGWCAPWPPGC